VGGERGKEGMESVVVNEEEIWKGRGITKEMMRKTRRIRKGSEPSAVVERECVCV
jgi:hypothetical protein